MIPYTDFKRLLTDTSECIDLDAYIAECGGSVPMDNADDVIDLMTTIWKIGHNGLTIKSIAYACDISVRQIALQYGLPTRTVENWSSNTTKPPEWQLPLLAYAVISDYING